MDAQNWEPLWRIAPEWSVDPIFLHELCLDLSMSKAELFYGRGTPMSLAELYEWQLYYNVKAEIQAEHDADRQREAERQRRMIG